MEKNCVIGRIYMPAPQILTLEDVLMYSLVFHNGLN